LITSFVQNNGKWNTRAAIFKLSLFVYVWSLPNAVVIHAKHELHERFQIWDILDKAAKFPRNSATDMDKACAIQGQTSPITHQIGMAS
jgi:hypothetical protein